MTREMGDDSTHTCLGALYVLEGATLGGQVLRREMAQRLGVNADNGGAFLDVYGAETGRRWRYPGARRKTAGAFPTLRAAGQCLCAAFPAKRAWPVNAFNKLELWASRP